MPSAKTGGIFFDSEGSQCVTIFKIAQMKKGSTFYVETFLCQGAHPDSYRDRTDYSSNISGMGNANSVQMKKGFKLKSFETLVIIVGVAIPIAIGIELTISSLNIFRKIFLNKKGSQHYVETLFMSGWPDSN
jgi:hypothetical protein